MSLLNILNKFLGGGKYFVNNLKNSFPNLLAIALLNGGVNHDIFLVLFLLL